MLFKRQSVKKPDEHNFGDEAKPTKVIGRDIKQYRFTAVTRHKKAILITLAVVVLLTGFIYVFKNQLFSRQKLACADVSPRLLLEASSFLGADKATKLKPVVEKIQALPDYEKDPNCLNVVVTYHINIADEKSARETLEKLELVYNSKKGFVDILKVAEGLDIEELRAGVEFIEKLNQEFKNNTFYGPEV